MQIKAIRGYHLIPKRRVTVKIKNLKKKKKQKISIGNDVEKLNP